MTATKTNAGRTTPKATTAAVLLKAATDAGCTLVDKATGNLTTTTHYTFAPPSGKQFPSGPGDLLVVTWKTKNYGQRAERIEEALRSISAVHDLPFEMTDAGLEAEFGPLTAETPYEEPRGTRSQDGAIDFAASPEFPAVDPADTVVVSAESIRRSLPVIEPETVDVPGVGPVVVEPIPGVSTDEEWVAGVNADADEGRRQERAERDGTHGPTPPVVKPIPSVPEREPGKNGRAPRQPREPKQPKPAREPGAGRVNEQGVPLGEVTMPDGSKPEWKALRAAVWSRYVPGATHLRADTPIEARCLNAHIAAGYCKPPVRSGDHWTAEITDAGREYGLKQLKAATPATSPAEATPAA